MDLKRARPGYAKFGPTALSRELGMSQPAASELLKTGRLAKDKIKQLVACFADVVGPEHWGLEYLQGPATVEVPPASIDAALDAIAASPHSEEVAQVLALYARTKAPAYRARISELLSGESVPLLTTIRTVRRKSA